ncbi:aliphatic sulfonates import ATP-binding protein SsuB [Methylobacterium gregans]|uniref:Aliphatic sulfonates import ATP-binding protein SsuB n=1 Tax=Methylobacterium gregans TaxID=374424 RepID=A0AA37HRV0_9HYPH|nr:ATP-binding cassette domain-containing protein [Methylobacterium gregans]MDQ0522980.1 sulfonate transport system ATP-binding protein [Methylobacterium gregans]GJD80693.1 Aliphatic sulfonates import ATP-binding protein SsuB [Methylobacterium gregans]GLS56304.1 aliphatic sulfonates import ATP-binding protein SsuB [Methylobacterium gregans]
MLLDAPRPDALGSTRDDASAAEAPRAATTRPPASGCGIAVTVRDLRKAFDGHTVIEGLDLHIPAGQFTTVVGRSGCGKSTLLRLILGLETPTGGRIQLEEPAGASRRNAPPKRIMFQDPRLLPWARVVDNVAVGLTGLGSRKERRERALAALAEVGLADKAGQWPATLSGGQRQRVALARALVSGPGLLALDEPLGALDALTRIGMQGLIERIWQQQGFTALLVTHDVSEAVALADRILVVDAGRIALDVRVDVPRPRRRGDPDLAALEGRILEHLLGESPAA